MKNSTTEQVDYMEDIMMEDIMMDVMELTEMNEKATVSLSLVLRHGHDAGDVVLLLAELLFGEVTDEVTSFAIVDGQHVEEERLHVVVERLVIEKEFGQQTQVLAVDFVDVAVHLKDRHVVLPVDLRGWRMSPQTLGHVTVQYRTTFHVFQTKLAQKELR